MLARLVIRSELSSATGPGSIHVLSVLGLAPASESVQYF
jgi:hypothetical protein